MMSTRRPPGPASFFRPKDPKPITINLTTRCKALLDQIAERNNASRADVIEWLVRTHGLTVDFEVMRAIRKKRREEDDE